jgi:hypothetical protein
MPLTRSLPGIPHVTPSGVRFDLTHRQKLFHCIVTQGALERLADRHLTMADFEQAFLDHRDHIETVASNKYDALPIVYRPFTITPDDLRQHRARRTAPAGTA